MKVAHIVILAFLLTLAECSGIFRSHMKSRPERAVHTRADDVGQPLILTPYIQAGQIQEAWDLSKTGPLTGTDVVSHSGYFTVNAAYDSNIFFWLFPALINPAEAPVVLWLQGGPGSSSMYALFVENGPFWVDENLMLHTRNYSWANEFNMIYIDSPVGTGFSYTGSDSGYATTEDDVATNLYSTLQQFFTLFPYYRTNEFFITGESYAGKYIPALSYKIHQENQIASDEFKINLVGLAIGDGLIDPYTMFNYGPFLYTIGLVDEAQRDHLEAENTLYQQYIDAQDWQGAFEVFDRVLNGDIWPYATYFENSTGFTYYFNYMRNVGNPQEDYYYDYLELPEVRKAIHVGNNTFLSGITVEMYLVNDMMQSQKPHLEALLDATTIKGIPYRICLYSGQLDIIVATDLTNSMINTMNWQYSNEYYSSSKLIWYANPNNVEVSGYVKQDHNFLYVIVRNAGHMVPLDQPEVAYNMITNFVFNRAFNGTVSQQ